MIPEVEEALEQTFCALDSDIWYESGGADDISSYGLTKSDAMPKLRSLIELGVRLWISRASSVLAQIDVSAVRNYTDHAEMTAYTAGISRAARVLRDITVAEVLEGK